MTASIKPEPEVRGSIVQPVTDEERLVTGIHLESDAEARDWGRQGWERARVAKAWCEARI